MKLFLLLLLVASLVGNAILYCQKEEALNLAERGIVAAEKLLPIALRCLGAKDVRK